MTDLSADREARVGPVARLVAQAKTMFSAPLYLVQRELSAGWTADALRQWATGRRRPKPEAVRNLAISLRQRAETMIRLADDLNELADRMERGEVPRPQRM